MDNETKKPKIAEKTAKPKTVAVPAGRYIEAIGRRKTAGARIRITPSAKTSLIVNGQPFDTYFKTDEQRRAAMQSIESAKLPSTKFSITAVVSGGGLTGQAEAVRHGIARCLIIHDIELRKKLKKAGYLKRDPRAKERRKFGLKKARKAPQWSKR